MCVGFDLTNSRLNAKDVSVSAETDQAGCIWLLVLSCQTVAHMLRLPVFHYKIDQTFCLCGLVLTLPTVGKMLSMSVFQLKH